MALLPRLRRFAAGLARNPADGDDLCQATVMRALEKRDMWQPGTRLDSWMHRMMRNIWIDESRARTRRGETFVAEDAGLSVGAGGGQEEAVELSVIDRGLRTLPDEQREAVLLVMVVELLNTGIETAIDRIGPEWHDLSKRAKDMGSAAVLLSVILAAGIWAAGLIHRFSA